MEGSESGGAEPDVGHGPSELLTEVAASGRVTIEVPRSVYAAGGVPKPLLRNFDDERVSDYHQELAIAYRLVRHGVPVLLARQSCNSRGHRDYTGGTANIGFWLPRGWQEAAPDPTEVERWRPGDGLLMVTGCGIDVLDIDPRNGGDVTFGALREAGCVPRILATAATPSGGEHHLVRSLGVRKFAFAGVDIQAGEPEGNGRGFVWIAPTRRLAKAGARMGEPVPYRWLVEPDEPDLECLAEDEGDDGADSLRFLISSHRPKGSRPAGVRGRHDAYQDAPRLQRQMIDRYLVHRIDSMRQLYQKYAERPVGWRDENGYGWERLVANAAFAIGGLARADWTPWDMDEGRQHFESVVPEVMRQAIGVGDKWPSQAMRGEPAPLPAHLSIGVVTDPDGPRADGGMVANEQSEPREEAHPQLQATEWFAEESAGRFLHVYGLGWHYWDGRRWAEDVGSSHAIRALRTTLADRLYDAIAGGRDFERQVHVARQCQTKSGMQAVLWHATHDDAFSADVSELDADPYLLNVANGTLDLRTMELRPHNPVDRLTKITRGAYVEGLVSAEWERFVARILTDEPVRRYFQRFLGLTLCGQPLEHVFTLAVGTGANGKGTCRTAVANALGDYHHEAPATLFLESKRNSGEANADLVALRGRRFVVASETDQGVRLSVSLMKQISGGDPITARRPYAQDPVTFQSTWTVLLVTNHLPKVPADDEAVWRRMRVVPFNEVIPEHERDGTLSERLTGEADAVLTWLVNGWKDYRSRATHGTPQGRLDEPRAVLESTSRYRAVSDHVARFVNDECVVDPGVITPSNELWTRWLVWSTGQPIPKLDRASFGERLVALGFDQRRTSKARNYVGIALGDRSTMERRDGA